MGEPESFEDVRVFGKCLELVAAGEVVLEVDIVGAGDVDRGWMSCLAGVAVVVITGLEADEVDMGAKALNGWCCIIGIPFAAAALFFVVDCRGLL